MNIEYKVLKVWVKTEKNNFLGLIMLESNRMKGIEIYKFMDYIFKMTAQIFDKLRVVSYRRINVKRR